MSLEARVSDRFLYLPSIGLAVGLALGLARWRDASRARVVAAATVAAALALGVAARDRATRFVSDDALFSWEAAHGDQSVTVLRNAALAAARAQRFLDARDLELRLLARYGELGFGDGYVCIVEAARHQVWGLGESFPEGMSSFEELARALLDGEDKVVDLYFSTGKALKVPTASFEARDYVAKTAPRLRIALAMLHAKRGEAAKALALVETALAECENCRGLAPPGAEVALALADPARARAIIAGAPVGERETDRWLRAAEVQEALLGAGPLGRALALFLGSAYGPACDAALASPPGQPAARRALAAACRLGARPDDARSLDGADAPSPELLRADSDARGELALAALAPRP